MGPAFATSRAWCLALAVMGALALRPDPVMAERGGLAPYSDDPVIALLWQVQQQVYAGNFDAAAEAYDEARRLDPYRTRCAFDFDIHRNDGLGMRIYDTEVRPDLHRGDGEVLSWEELNTRLEADPDDADLLRQRALAYAMVWGWEPARVDLSAAMAADPGDPTLLALRGMAFAHQDGREAEARDDLSQAIERGAEGRGAVIAYVGALLELGDDGSACPMLDAAKAIGGPEDALLAGYQAFELYFFAAVCAQDSDDGSAKDARREMEQVYEAWADRADAYCADAN